MIPTFLVVWLSFILATANAAFMMEVYSSSSRIHAAHGAVDCHRRCRNNMDGNHKWASAVVALSAQVHPQHDPGRRRMVTSTLVGCGLSLLQLTTAVQPAAAVAKDLKEEYRQGTAALGMTENDSMAPVPQDAYKKLPSGVIYADVRPATTTNGMLPTAKVGSKVNIQWVLRKSNGYFVDSSRTNDSVPFVFTIGDQTAIVGLDEGIRGMGVGGVRRLIIPPSLAYVQGVADQLPGPIPTGYGPRQQIRRVQSIRKDVPGEYIYLEIQLTRLR
jgi:FKBP-type peptidyl-prolyl cis-trans isomerase